MRDTASRRGAANLGMPLMIVAFLGMAGFLYWLNVQATADKASRQVVEEPVVVGPDMSGATGVAGADLQVDPGPYVGMVIRVEGLTVVGAVGTQGFWLELPNKNPFLVSMSEGLKAEGVTVTAGQKVTVAGRVYAMGDSVLTAWSTAGTIGEGDRLAAEFATHFIEADAVVVSGGSGGEG